MKVVAEISLHAGGAWDGHTFFIAKNPLTGMVSYATNYLVDIMVFCEKQNIEMDREIMDKLLSQLHYDTKYGWLVPRHHLTQGRMSSSAYAYLKKIQENLF